jgi:hypothetical protein
VWHGEIDAKTGQEGERRLGEEEGALGNVSWNRNNSKRKEDIPILDSGGEHQILPLRKIIRS